MFRVQAPVIVIFSTEARAALGPHQRAAGLAAWRALAGLGRGLEMAHFQIVVAGTTLAVSSRLRRDAQIEIEIGLGDPRQGTRVIPAAALREAEARARGRRAVSSRAR